MNEKLTQLRRDLQREAEMMDRKGLKGLRWLLMKHPSNLDDSKNERVRLQEALDLNRSLAVAYYLKQDLSQLWQQSTKADPAGFLTDWCRRARASGIRVLGCDLRNALQKWKKVVYVKRGVLPVNVGSHTNKTGRNTFHGRSGYSTGIGLYNSEGDHQ